MGDVSALLKALGEVDLSAQEVLERLAISRPTLSRLVKSAGPRIVRWGQTRATRYAATRSLRGAFGGVPIRRIGAGGTPENFGVLYPLAGRAHLLLRQEGPGTVFEGIPPFVEDMRPQGFLGRHFAARNVNLELPPRLQDWSADDILLALIHRGEDALGNLILGDPSFDRWLASAPIETPRAEYPQRARAASLGELGSSAGGEHPKFAAWTGERHVLVKYAASEEGGEVTQRWRDLLVCEALALEVLTESGVVASRAEWFDIDGMRFLEVERFDRLGPRGRRGMVSLGVWNNEFLGTHRGWTSAAAEMERRGELSGEEARPIRWLDVFGELIGNNDRHLWNLSFFWDTVGKPSLAPVYDMLPMLFAPATTGLTEREFAPAAPTAATVDVWSDAAERATAFWDRVVACGDLSPGFRAVAERARDALVRKRGELAHLGA